MSFLAVEARSGAASGRADSGLETLPVHDRRLALLGYTVLRYDYRQILYGRMLLPLRVIGVATSLGRLRVSIRGNA